MSGSSDVTDKGVHLLCQPSAGPDLEELVVTCWCPSAGGVGSGGNTAVEEKRQRKISAPARVGNNISQWISTRFGKGMRRHSVTTNQNGVNAMKEAQPYAAYGDLMSCGSYRNLPAVNDCSGLWPEDEELPQQQFIVKKGRSCANSLRKISLSGTQVTEYGLQFVQESAPQVAIWT